MANLGVDPAAVSAGAGFLRGAHADAPSSAAVVPCAGDCASVDGANWLASQIAALNRAIAAAGHEAEVVSRRLHASATAYEQQEWFSAAALGGGSGGGLPTGMPDVLPAALPMPAAPPAGGGGVEPTSGRQASLLIHSGPGPQGLDAAQAALTARAVQLDLAATSVRAARDLVAHSWQSTAADTALAQLSTLESRYEGLAAGARQLAGQGRTLASNFQRTLVQMPTPQQFEDTTARLNAAIAANQIPGNQGRATAAVRHFQQQLATLEGQGRTLFTGYQTTNGEVRTGLAPSAEAGTDSRGMPGPAGTQPDGRTQPGAGANGDPTAAGQANALNDPQQMGGAAMSQILGSVVPAVGSAMAGGLGAVTGGGAGATAPLSSLGQLASGFAGAATGMAGSHAGDSPSGSGGDSAGGSPDIGKGLGGGGGGAGGTEPASAPAGPLVAPASAAGASAAAAPASVAGVGGASPASPASAGMGGMGGAGMGGGMMSPMMGGPMGGAGGGGGGSEAERQLYAERRLRIETPANSEPVKGRRETRRSRDDRPSG